MIAKGAKALLVGAAAVALSACASTRSEPSFEAQYALAQTALQRDIAVLASEEFVGRRPATIGEEKTLSFMQRELEKAGFLSGTNDPANPWRAPVRLVTSTALSGSLTLTMGGKNIAFTDQESAALTGAKRALVEDAQIVFVGKAEEGVDAAAVLGKVAVLIGDPGKSPERRAKLFEQGAAAVITVVETASSIASLRRFAGRESFQLASEVDDNLSAYVTAEALEKALPDWPKYQAELQVAHKTDAQAVLSVKITARIEATSDRKEAKSHNLIGKLPGAKPGSGALLLLGHWDHFGECGEIGDEDRLCNGAADNASGIASMLELARRLAKSGPHDRDIYVLGTTAEEWGLLGAKAFVEAPPLPLGQITAAFNFDTVAIAPRGSDIGFIGEGETALDPVVLDAIAKSGRKQGSRVLAEQFLRRQDGWALLQKDVPTVMISSSFGNEEILNTYLQTRYHNAADEAEGLELGGAVEDLLLHEALIRQVADAELYPSGAE
jgi:acetylornithine deacetylase/succinyl-diaminopimelate desuccinylase-like protein